MSVKLYITKTFLKPIKITSKIWKGIRSIVNLNGTSKRHKDN